MWLFNRKLTLESGGVFDGFTDCHSHILPGVDDGIPDMASSLQVLERYEQLGVIEVWLTPHVMEDIPNTTSDLRQRFEELLSAYKGSIKLHLAAEYMLDNGFEERLSCDDFLCIQSSISNSRPSILIETSYFTPSMNLYETIERIMEKGYQPLMAHPERYIYMDCSDYERIKDMGVKFQCNITSLAGVYGKEARCKFLTFLSKGWIQTIGTDIHRLSSFNHAISTKCITEKQRVSLLGVMSQFS